MPVLSLADADLDFDVRGDEGPAVVQLHGLTSSRRRDAVLGVAIADGLAGCRVLRYDARGHGRSTGPDDPAAYTWPRLAEDLLGLLDHVFGDEPVHGVGPSMGTGTLLHATAMAPGRFAGLTLVIPPTAWESREPQRAAYLESADVVETAGVDELVERGRLLPRPPAVDPTIPVTWPDVEPGLLATVFRGATLTDLPAPEVVAGIDLPTLILAWADDPVHPLDTAQRLVEMLPRSELAVAGTPADVARWPALLAASLGREPDGRISARGGRPRAARP